MRDANASHADDGADDEAGYRVERRYVAGENGQRNEDRPRRECRERE